MAIKKEIEIVANSKKAEASLNDVVDVLKDIQKQNVKNEKSFEDTTKAIKGAESATKTLAKGFRTAGLALKAVGIGLALEAFAILKDLFMSNQKVADFFGTSIKGLGIVFNDLFSFVFDNVPKVSALFKDVFENPSKYIEILGQQIKTQMIERFESLLDVTALLAGAFKKFFEGDFEGVLDNIKAAGQEAVDVVTGVDDSFNKGIDAINKVAGAVDEYAKETWNSAAALQAQENAAALSAAQQAGLVEEYNRQASLLKQIRDNDLKSIQERIDANEKLAEVLNNQEKAMKAEAAAQVLAAENALRLNDTIENQVALIESRNNVKSIEAQIDGLREEQLTNRTALEKEALDLGKSRLQGENELAIAQKVFDAERKSDELERLQALRESLEIEKQIELERLQNNVSLYKEGTQARVDAELELAAKKQEVNNALIANQDEIDKVTKQRQDDEVAREQALNQSKLQMANSYFGDIASILGTQNKIGKKFAVAQALMNTYQGISNVWAEKSEAGLVGAGLIQRLATTAIVAAQGFATVKNIMKTNPTGGGATSAGGGGGSSAAPPPAFNVVGTSGANQIAEQLSQEQEPIQAFVVGSNVTTQQELDRNIVTTASLG